MYVGGAGCQCALCYFNENEETWVFEAGAEATTSSTVFDLVID